MLELIETIRRRLNCFGRLCCCFSCWERGGRLPPGGSAAGRHGGPGSITGDSAETVAAQPGRDLLGAAADDTKPLLAKAGMAADSEVELEVRRRREKEKKFIKGEFIIPGSEAQRSIADRLCRELGLVSDSLNWGQQTPRGGGGGGGCSGGSGSVAALAAGASSGILDMQQEECVICLEGFSAENPEMPTLCGCGVSKSYFHFPCLLQWLEGHKSVCPACRQPLYYEEVAPQQQQQQQLQQERRPQQPPSRQQQQQQTQRGWP